MKVFDILSRENLDNCFLVGYYGDGNFGDELLLEVILNCLYLTKRKSVRILYKNISCYKKFHHDFGAVLVNTKNKFSLIKSIIISKNIIIGGGGLWGLDSNKNIFLMSLFLLFSRFFLRKKIFLLGVGFYNSTDFFGRVAGNIAGLSSNVIICRDRESFLNFSLFRKKTFIDNDISFLLKKIDLKKYFNEEKNFSNRILKEKEKKIFFISIRGKNSNYENVVNSIIRENKDKFFIFSSLLSTVRYPENSFMDKTIKYENVFILRYEFNPIILYLFFLNNNKRIASVSPQYHGIALGYLSGVPFFPVSYDNKCSELLSSLNKKAVSVEKLRKKEIQDFINANYV